MTVTDTDVVTPAPDQPLVKLHELPLCTLPTPLGVAIRNEARRERAGVVGVAARERVDVPVPRAEPEELPLAGAGALRRRAPTVHPGVQRGGRVPLENAVARLVMSTPARTSSSFAHFAALLPLAGTHERMVASPFGVLPSM